MRRTLVMSVLACVLVAGGTVPVSAATTSSAPPTTWLCKPGRKDACTMGLGTTSFTPTGRRLAVSKPKASSDRTKFDCFYVYPTVSDQPTPNANLAIDPEVRSIVRYQAARYGQYCQVYAPVYRQGTLKAILDRQSRTTDAFAIAYGDVRAAFEEYLKKDNHGHGFVLIGHSQGAGMLTRLVQDVIDNNPKVRKRLVSAILLGGNVEVAKGHDVGGSFQHVPACRSRKQTGCVVAYSTFGETPPANSIFGRPGGALSGGSAANDEVLCTNPAALGGGAADVTAIAPSEPFAPKTTIGAATLAVGAPPKVHASTPWIAFPRSSRAECSSAGGANVLLVTPRGGGPTPHAVPDATWGLHLLDANVAQGDLVNLVHDQEIAYQHRTSS